jgi:hypothetical protein
MRYIQSTKEYYGDRPCIDPLTMAELRIRCARNKAVSQPLSITFLFINLWKRLFS